MTATRYDCYAIKANALVLGGMTSCGINIASTILAEAADGQVNPRAASLVGQRVGGTFSGRAVAGCLDLCGQQGTSIAGITGGLILYAYKHTDGGTRGTSTDHKSFTFNKGLLVPRRLAAGHQSDAEISYEIIAAYNGTNNPVVVTESVAAPAITAGTTDRFTLGPISIGGVDLSAYRSLEIDFGVDARSEGAESDIWDTVASVVSARPTITIRGIDPGWLKTTGAIDLDGLAATHLNTTIYLRKRDLGGTFVADGTASHVAITACGIATITDFSAGSGGPAETGLQIVTYHDGTNLPLVIDTSAAIT